MSTAETSRKPGRAYQSARRAKAAADTRDTILTVALGLFVEHGYGKVTVSDIARAASVAVPTVYTSTGGKSAILGALIDKAMRDPIVDETLTAVDQCRTPDHVMRVTANGVRVDNERHHSVVRVMEAAAALDKDAAGILVRSDEGYRQALAHVADRLRDMGALKSGLTSQQATDILWFYFGRGSWHVLVSGRQWTWERAEEWLACQASIALLDRDLTQAPHESLQ
jgi:AcrR family transcriptional regulator